MKHLKTFEEKLQESSSPNQLTIDQKKFLDECVRGYWEQVPETGAIDVYGSFTCENKGISDLKGLVFNSITASFNVEGNKLRSM